MKAKKKAAKPKKKPPIRKPNDNRRKLFVDAYIANGGNGAEAAITAGYGEKGAKQQASRLMTDVDLKAEITRRQSEVIERVKENTGLSAERTIKELHRLTVHDPRRMLKPDGTVLPMHEWDDDIAACVASFEVDEITVGGVIIGVLKKVKFWDKNSAIDKSMKHFGQYDKDNEQKAVAARTVVINVQGR